MLNLVENILLFYLGGVSGNAVIAGKSVGCITCLLYTSKQEPKTGIEMQQITKGALFRELLIYT